jgi:hypothetical protein
MHVEAAVLAVVVGLLRKGRLANLGGIPFRGAYAFAIPLVFFIAATILTYHTHNEQLIRLTVRTLNVLLYVVLLGLIAINLHIREMKLMGIGTFLNFLALTANGGTMPVSRWAAKTAGMLDYLEHMDAARHVIMTPETRLKPLVDLIPIAVPRLTTVLSIGDVLLAIGIFLLIQRYMCMPSPGAQIEKTN